MNYLERIERQLDLPSAEKAEVMREIRAHYEELRDELMASGMAPEKIDIEAEKTIGVPEVVGRRLSAVHSRATWKSVILAILPVAITLPLRFFAHWPNSITYAIIMAAVAGFFLAGCVRELKTGRQRVWLATWLAASIYCAEIGVTSLLYATYKQLGLVFAYRSVRNSLILVAPNVLIPMLVMVVSGWRSKNARLLGISTVALAGAAACFALFYKTGFRTILLTSYLLPLFLWMMIAINVFASRSYSNRALAALFLYCGVMRSGVIFATDSPTLFKWATTAGYIIAVGMIVAFARASTSFRKLVAIGLAIFLSLMSNMAFLAITRPLRTVYLSVDMMAFGAIFALIIFGPAIVAKRLGLQTAE